MLILTAWCLITFRCHARFTSQVTILLKDYLLRHLTIKDMISASAADEADECFSLACECQRLRARPEPPHIAPPGGQLAVVRQRRCPKLTVMPNRLHALTSSPVTDVAVWTLLNAWWAVAARRGRFRLSWDAAEEDNTEVAVQEVDAIQFHSR